MKKLLTGLLLALCATLSLAAWPTRPVTLVIPFAPGALATRVANAMQIEFETKYKTPLIVKYMPGAGAAVAVNHVLGEANDDHTLLWLNDDFVTAQYMQGTHLYERFVPLNIISTFGAYVYGNSNTSVEKFAITIRNTGAVNIGNMGVNGGYETWTKQLKYPGLKVNPIPYKGAAAMQTDVIGGHLEYGLGILTNSQQLVDEGKIKIIMTTTLERISATKDVPTFRELGLQGEPYYGFYGIFTRKDTSSGAAESAAKFLKDFVGTNPEFVNQAQSGIAVVVNYDPKRSERVISDTIKRLEKMTKK
jgi:tripartite-type tricarboxylate transporter receptor subunit TctC